MRKHDCSFCRHVHYNYSTRHSQNEKWTEWVDSMASAEIKFILDYSQVTVITLEYSLGFKREWKRT